jgi:spore maturation protein CgeB
MSHLKTYPNIYIPNETYVPLDWDGNDLFEKTAYYMENEKDRARIAQNAFEQYRNELNRMEDYFSSLFNFYFFL